MVRKRGKNKMKESKGTGRVINIILLIAFIGATVLMVTAYKGGLNMETSQSKKDIQYSNIKSILGDNGALGGTVELPYFIDRDSEVKATSSMGLFLQIIGDHYVLKVSEFVDINADPLALYESSNDEIDNKYILDISNDEYSNLTFFRYRTGVENLTHCTVVNWVNGDNAYGIIFDDIYDEDSILDLFNIERGSLEDYVEDEVEVEDATTLSNEYTFGDKVVLTFPTFNSDIKNLDMGGKEVFYMGDKMVFAIVYNDFDIDSDFLGGQGEKEIILENGEKVVIRYLLDNPFIEGSDEYIDYNTFLDNLDKIVESAISK